MAVKFGKGKAAQEQSSAQSIAKPAHKPVFKHLTDEQLLVNELCLIEEQLKEIEAFKLLEKKEVIKRKLADIAASSDPATEVVLHGTDGNRVVFSTPPVMREISDKPAFIQKLGVGLFKKIAKVTFTDAEKYLSEEELADVVSMSYGTRRLTYVGK
jgi:hypothetical protein